jgi:hypothetical protein
MRSAETDLNSAKSLASSRALIAVTGYLWSMNYVLNESVRGRGGGRIGSTEFEKLLVPQQGALNHEALLSLAEKSRKYGR